MQQAIEPFVIKVKIIIYLAVQVKRDFLQWKEASDFHYGARTQKIDLKQ